MRKRLAHLPRRLVRVHVHRQPQLQTPYNVCQVVEDLLSSWVSPPGHQHLLLLLPVPVVAP